MVGREAAAVAVEAALGVLAAVLLLRPFVAQWRQHLAIRWPAYDAAWQRLPEPTRRRIRRELLRGRSIAAAPELLGLATIELTHRVYRAAAIRPRRGLAPTVIAQLAALPLVPLGLFAVGDTSRAWSELPASRCSRRCSATTSACASAARTATESELRQAGEDTEAARSRVRALLDGLPGREVKSRLAATAQPGSVGWLPIVAFVAAAFLVGAWGDGG